METQITLDPQTTNAPSGKTTQPQTQHASLAAWAKALGFGAKTHAGQRKAILASFSGPVFGTIPRMGYRPSRVDLAPSAFYLDGKRGIGSKAAYLTARARADQERFAASHPLTLSSPPPATRLDVTGYPDKFGFGSHERTVLELQSERYGVARVGDWYIRCDEQVSWDHNYYAKSYGHPKKTVESRTVLIRRVAADGTLEKRDVEVSAWRGNFLLDALISAGVTPAHKGQMNIRLHAAYDVQSVRDAGALKIYERTLAGNHIDFCAVRGDLTFHAPTPKAAVQGLREKRRARMLRAQGRIIDYRLCKSLRFCDEGLRAFCRTFDLDMAGEYTPEQIAERVGTDLSAAMPFRSELMTLAGAVGYQVPLEWL